MFSPLTRILIVEDMTTMRALIWRALEDMGYESLAEAADGEEAWTEIEAAADEGAPFGLIVADWSMPKMSGLDLLKKVRASSRHRQVPFILLTAETEKGHVMQAIQAGVSNYITKPFTQATLVEKLQSVHAALQKKQAG